MGTKFEEIYCLNTVLKKDSNIAKLPIYQYYEICYKDLQIGKTSFVYDCLKNLDKYSPYLVTEYLFKGNGVDKEFILTPFPSDIQNNLYVGILNEEENTIVEENDYVYDIATHTITLTRAPINESQIYIGCYSEPEFEETLDDDEKVILAECMQISFLERHAANTNSLNQKLYSSTFKFHSQAEQIKQLSNLSISQWKDRVDNLIKKYSYNKSKDGLKGLAGKKRRYYGD